MDFISVQNFDFRLCFLFVILISHCRISINGCPIFGVQFIPLKDIAAKYELSTKYLEQVAHILSKGGLLDALCGLDGGYRLNRLPSQYRVSEILLLAEGNRNERLLDFNILSGFNNLWQAAEDCHYSILEKKTLEDVLKEQTDI